MGTFPNFWIFFVSRDLLKSFIRGSVISCLILYIVYCNKSGPSDLLIFNLFKRSWTSSSDTDIDVDSIKHDLSGSDP